MRNLLVVVDMQNDFIDGSLGTKEAQGIVGNVVGEIKKYQPQDVFYTRDTHETDYLSTQEGKKLPIEHCIRNTQGWEIRPEIAAFANGATIIDKPTFGSIVLAKEISNIAKKENGNISVTLIGLCTDICVVSNALLIKAYLPEIPVKVIASCCAGVTPEAHTAALTTMKSCQIEII